MTRTYRVLTGPTAAGKTAFLLRRTESMPLAVISADSRQIYRYMNIGTSKPVSTEQEMLPHFGVDCLIPGIRYSAYQFLIIAVDALSRSFAGGREIWVCGGTGLYIHALVSGMDLGEAPRPLLRDALGQRLREVASSQMADELQLQVADPANPVRVIRAAEQECADPGRAASIYRWAGLNAELVETEGAGDENWVKVHAELAKWSCRGIAVLDPGQKALAARIEERVRGMFAVGLVEEVAELRRRGFGDTDVVRDGIGYREAGAVLDGTMSEENAITATITRTRQYAKRQRTYFRGRGWPVVTPAELPGWIEGTG